MTERFTVFFEASGEYGEADFEVAGIELSPDGGWLRGFFDDGSQGLWPAHTIRAVAKLVPKEM